MQGGGFFVLQIYPSPWTNHLYPDLLPILKQGEDTGNFDGLSMHLFHVTLFTEWKKFGYMDNHPLQVSNFP
jgi:hypothetical protein